jgi:hypothetical protein
MVKPIVETRVYKVYRPFIWAQFEKDIPYQYYTGTYQHPLVKSEIRGSSWETNPYSFADFISQGNHYSLRINQYMTPRAFCRRVKTWIEETLAD